MPDFNEWANHSKGKILLSAIEKKPFACDRKIGFHSKNEEGGEKPFPFFYAFYLRFFRGIPSRCRPPGLAAAISAVAIFAGCAAAFSPFLLPADRQGWPPLHDPSFLLLLRKGDGAQLISVRIEKLEESCPALLVNFGYLNLSFQKKSVIPIHVFREKIECDVP